MQGRSISIVSDLLRSHGECEVTKEQAFAPHVLLTAIVSAVVTEAIHDKIAILFDPV